MRPWIAAVALALISISCNQSRNDAATESKAEPGYAAPQPTAPAMRNEVRQRAMAVTSDADLSGGAVSPPDEKPVTPSADAATPAMIIRTGSASVEVDTLEPAVAQLQQLALRLGGYVANSSLQDGRNQLRQATLEIKVPAPRFDDLTAGLRPFGKVEHITVNAEDVGEEFTDLTARVANARRLEERLIDLLANRTGRLQDVLAVERELARVRETIERYEGRLRYLKTRVATSTLTVTLHEPEPILSNTPGKNVIVDAFLRAWRNFVAVVAGLIASLGIIVPLAALLAVAVFLWRRYRKH